MSTPEGERKGRAAMSCSRSGRKNSCAGGLNWSCKAGRKIERGSMRSPSGVKRNPVSSEALGVGGEKYDIGVVSEGGRPVVWEGRLPDSSWQWYLCPRP